MNFFEKFAAKKYMKALAKAKTHGERMKYRLKLLNLGTDVLDYLEECASAPQVEVRKAVIGVLKETHALRAKKMLLDRLKFDSSDAVRYKSAEALSRFKGDETVEALVEALDDPSEKVRLCACVALKTLLGHVPGTENGQKNGMTGSRNLMMDSEQLDRQVQAWVTWWKEEHEQLV